MEKECYKSQFEQMPLEELAVKFSKHGIHTIGPFEGKRMRKDGRLLEWKMLFIKQEENGPKLPFFIQWNETDEERRNDLRNIGTITEHKNNVQQIETDSLRSEKCSRNSTEMERSNGAICKSGREK